LNSQLMNWFHQAMTAEEGRAFAEVKIVNLKKLPIKETSIEEQAPFVTIVEKILAITESDDYAESTTLQTQVKEYESQIDQMVYKLYGLTAEEIAIIEGKSKTS